MPDLNFIVNLTLTFFSNSQAKSIHDALVPDNVNFPSGLDIKMVLKDNYVHFKIGCNNYNTLINTMDELLNDINLAKNVLSL